MGLGADVLRRAGLEEMLGDCGPGREHAGGVDLLPSTLDATDGETAITVLVLAMAGLV